MLGTGPVLIIVGALVGGGNDAGISQAATGGVVAGIGVLSMLGSIPLFIASGKNKRRGNAMSASIHIENTETIQG